MIYALVATNCIVWFLVALNHTMHGDRSNREVQKLRYVPTEPIKKSWDNSPEFYAAQCEVEDYLRERTKC